MITIAHIINPYQSDDASESHKHAITFRSIEQASRQINPEEIHLGLLTAQHSSDHAVIPDDYHKTKDFHRSVTDRHSFTKPKQLPLLKDILDRLYESSNAEYLIYTNMDIIVQPNFYEQVAQLIAKGHDAFIINRRRIEDKDYSEDELPQILQQKGNSHPGFDCFVFHRSLYPYFQLGDVCVGIPFAGVTLAHNLFCFARYFGLYDDLHLTTHLGMEVLPKRDKEYYWHNRREFQKIVQQLWHRFNIERFPYADLPLIERYYKWARNPSLFTLMNMKLDFQRLQKKLSPTKKSRKRNIQGKKV